MPAGLASGDAAAREELAVRMASWLEQHAPQWGIGPALAGPVRHCLNSRGKLLRPYVATLACQSVGGDHAAITPGLWAVELGHMASLVHDDIIDRSALRRNRPAVQAAFGLPLALLTGDSLIFASFQALYSFTRAEMPPGRVLAAGRLLARAYQDLCAGEAQEEAWRPPTDGEGVFSAATYLEIARLKTASLFAAAAALGGLLGGGNDEQVEALHQYGTHLGVAFQIYDDLLPFGDRPDKAGKPADTDFRRGLRTLPLLCALETASPAARQELSALLTEPPVADTFPRYRSLVLESGGLQRAAGEAQRYAALARSALAALSPGAVREALAGLTGKGQPAAAGGVGEEQ